jgi:hypothetical protein
MDELKRGLEEPDGPLPPPTDRNYWENRASKAAVQLADELLGIAREFDPTLELQYNKHYIGIYKGGQPFNFCLFHPRKSRIILEIKLPRSDEIDSKIEDAGIESLSYSRWGRYRLSLEKDDITKHRELLKQLMESSHQIRSE